MLCYVGTGVNAPCGRAGTASFRRAALLGFGPALLSFVMATMKHYYTEDDVRGYLVS
jgi:hypothetical protein